jgi:predicted MPP superfamily phosphohydrolase
MTDKTLSPKPGLSRRAFLKMSIGSAILTGLAGVAGFGYAHDVEPGWLDIVQMKLKLPRLDPAFDGYKLAQFSDIHMGTGMTPERLKQIVSVLNEQMPDLIALTGDFVTGGPIDQFIPSLVEALKNLKAKDGTVSILGNHDHWTDPDAIHRVIHDSGMIDLTNTVYTLKRGASQLHIGGVDDYWERKAQLDDVLAILPADGAAILLAHEPDFADVSAATGRFDLQLSGHSHGGQVIMPFVGPLALPHLGRKYPLGQYQVGTMIQYTNRGVGTIAPPIRFNCRPEITVFTLTTA